MTLTQDQRDAFERDGFFVLRGFVDPSIGVRMTDETIAAVYHYGEAGAQPLSTLAPIHEKILQWRPVMRGGATATTAYTV